MTTHAIKRHGFVEAVARNIRAECSRQGLNQTDLALALGISTSAVSLRWRGMRQWQLEDVGRVADVLGVDVRVLVTDTARYLALSAPATELGLAA